MHRENMETTAPPCHPAGAETLLSFSSSVILYLMSLLLFRHKLEDLQLNQCHIFL